jgi:serine/threonine protein phosphatase PrpC
MPNVFSFTEAGGHVTNEDAFLIERHPADAECLLCALADGQGGRAGGRRAAEVACRSALDAAVQHAVPHLANTVVWPTILRFADESVAADGDAGFTTLVAFCVTGGRIAGASSGDSALVAVVEGGAEVLTAHQMKNPPLGSSGAIFVPFAAALRQPRRVLTMSDGVWKYVGMGGVLDAATRQKGSDLIEVLTAKARLPGSGKFQDDFTVVVVEDE